MILEILRGSYFLLQIHIKDPFLSRIYNEIPYRVEQGAGKTLFSLQGNL
jgi:hypothetical protein